jgi:acid phosphatase/lysosomal acid phosphatase/prostatic aicd phosphatase
MRKRYIEDNKLLSSTYNASEITIYATDVNRTIMSAMSNF